MSCTACYLLLGKTHHPAAFVMDGHSFCTDHLELWLPHDPAAYRMRAGGSRPDMLRFVAHLKAGEQPAEERETHTITDGVGNFITTKEA